MSQIEQSSAEAADANSTSPAPTSNNQLSPASSPVDGSTTTTSAQHLSSPPQVTVSPSEALNSEAALETIAPIVNTVAEGAAATTTYPMLHPHENPNSLDKESPLFSSEAPRSSTVETFSTKIAMSGSARPGKVEVKLFVGRLPRTIEESQLTPLFTAFGDVVETIIIRDKATGMHKGSAFVKMASLTEADAAVRALHNVRVVDPQLGPIQVKYANGEPERLGLSMDSAQAGNDLGKLFVGGLPRTVSEADVRKVFEPYGRVDEVILMKDSVTGQPKGCAFVKFAFKETAIHAIKGLHGQFTFPGCPRPLEVKFAENRRAAVTTTSGVQPSTVLTGYTAAQPGGTSNMPLRGTTLPAQHSNLNPRSACGWTEYFTVDGRAYYHHELTKTTQWTKPLEFDRMVLAPPPPVSAVGTTASSTAAAAAAAYMPSASDAVGPPGANVFVFHIPNEWGQNEVITHFSQFGRVISCYVATDRTTGRNKGYGFVSYDNIQSSANAVLGMNGYPVGSKRLKVSIKTGEESYVAHLLGPQSVLSSGPPGAGPLGGSGGGSYAPVGVFHMPQGGAPTMGSYRSVPY